MTKIVEELRSEKKEKMTKKERSEDYQGVSRRKDSW